MGLFDFVKDIGKKLFPPEAKPEDAATKMQKAQRHITKVLGNKINAKNKVSTLGGGTPAMRHRINQNLINGPG